MFRTTTVDEISTVRVNSDRIKFCIVLCLCEHLVNHTSFSTKLAYVCVCVCDL